MQAIHKTIGVYSKPKKHTLFLDGHEVFTAGTEVDVCQFLLTQIDGWPREYEHVSSIGNEQGLLTTFTRKVL